MVTPFVTKYGSQTWYNIGVAEQDLAHPRLEAYDRG